MNCGNILSYLGYSEGLTVCRANVIYLHNISLWCSHVLGENFDEFGEFFLGILGQDIGFLR